MLSPEQLQILRDKYLELIRLEVDQFNVKPTEVRHLIGRLGELQCALEVGGTLAHVVNQHGFDVTSPEGTRISVKTTAQTAGFVNLRNVKSINTAEELMILQYRAGEDELSVVYHGPIAQAREAARLYRQHYELDLSTARRLMQEITSPQDDGVVTPAQTHPHRETPGTARDEGATPPPTT
ncbi:hypothetical protein OS176_04705 [Xanthomonadaceae bacterium XH05]|nr:hypothetical protein [Xanthomonadaceae bacterium XH05]